jgi:hypothetical protein
VLEDWFVVHVRRGLLFWGLFLIPLGAVPLLVRAGALDADLVAQAWRLWPLLLVALGLTLILGRSRAGILGTVVAALALGTVAGGALAASTPWIGNVGGCGASTSTADERVEGSGTFAGPGSAEFDLNCGALDVSMTPGTDWHVIANYRGERPRIDGTVDSLRIDSPDTFNSRRQSWQVELPTDRTSDISINAGRVRIRAGGDLHGSLSANAGSLELCAPPDAALRIRVEEQLTFGHNLDDRGLTKTGDVWSRTGSPSGGLVDLEVQGNAANLTLDPDGGC